MKHQVSATAANSFWDVGFKYLPRVLDQRRGKKVPKFVHQRRKMMKDDAPKVEMEHVYKKTTHDSIIKIKGSVAPVKAYQTNPMYEKLYETAHVKVKLIYFIITSFFCILT